MIKLYNSLSGKKEIFKPRLGKQINIFVCGSTVYDQSHLGHARTSLIFDALVKYLRISDYSVFYLQNVTDIDDKIINRAKVENISSKNLARKYEKIYHQAEKDLGIDSVSQYARATDYIPQIINQVKILIKKGCAYFIEGDGYYFDLTSFSRYGQLSKRKALKEDDSLSRIDETINKKNKGDFCLWKLYKKGEPFWLTELGKGRPGWHIEDTAISEHFFGSQYDLHGGGLDLKFPHHEAEIAQQESISGKTPMVKIWLHTGMLLIENHKMSKSLGNFITINDFLKSYSKEVLRMYVFSNHYRSPFNYQSHTVNQAAKNIETLSDWSKKLKETKVKDESLDKLRTTKIKFSNNILNKKIKKYSQQFSDALADDFNTPKAIGIFFKLINESNVLINQDSLVMTNKQELEKFSVLVNSILGIIPKIVILKIPSQIKKLVQERELLRQEKKWDEGDEIRLKIEKLGYLVDDTTEGPVVKKLEILKVRRHF